MWAGSPLWVQRLVRRRGGDPERVDLSSLTVAMFSWGAMTPDLFPRLKAAAGGEIAMLEVFGQTESQSCFRFWPDARPERAAEAFARRQPRRRPDAVARRRRPRP